MMLDVWLSPVGRTNQKGSPRLSHLTNTTKNKKRVGIILRGDFGRVSRFCLSLRKTYSVKKLEEKNSIFEFEIDKLSDK